MALLDEISALAEASRHDTESGASINAGLLEKERAAHILHSTDYSGAEIKMHAQIVAELAPAFTPPPFEKWPEMQRWRSVTCLLTEKLDGSNGQVVVPANPSDPVVGASRTRYVGPIFGCENFGFGQWVHDNQEALRRLGPGRHYGEWWGAGIQRRYGLEQKRFSLFNARRWTFDDKTGKGGLPEGLPAELGVVPILYQGPFDPRKVDEVIAKLFREGSAAVPGWRGHGKEGPEGVVIQIAGCTSFKLTDNGDAKKGRQHHVEAVLGQLSVTTDVTVSDGTWTLVSGQDISGQTWEEVVGTTGDVRATMYQVANEIVTSDSAIMNSRKVT